MSWHCGATAAGRNDVSAGRRWVGHANELVALVRREFPQFSIAVQAYPEKHREAPSPEVDLENLKRKVDTGADAVITQLFYNNADFLRFRTAVRQLASGAGGAGHAAVTNFSQIQRITSMCGAKLPAEFFRDLEAAGDDTQAQFDMGSSSPRGRRRP